ncbi:MAG TPA: hypothetical protein VIS73_10835 [Rhodocyclaceae bacterium]
MSLRDRRRVAIAAIVGAALAMLPSFGQAMAPTVNGHLRLVQPASEVVAADAARTIVIDAGAYRGPLILIVDGTDVSARVRREGERLVYELSAPLNEGVHRVQVIAPDPSGPGNAEWTFTVGAGVAASGRREVYSRSSLSASASRVFGDPVQGDDWVSNASLGIDVGVRSGETELSLQTQLAYASTADNNDFEPNGYVLTLRNDDDSLALGDVSFRGTPLTAPGLARRGALAQLNFAGTAIQIAQVNSGTVTGWRDGLGSDNQIRAASLSQPITRSGDDPFTLTAIVVRGESANAGSSNVATVEPPTSGRVAGLQGSGRLFGTGLNFEGAWSDFDADTTDGVAARRDQAVVLQLDGALGPIGLSGSYQYAGPDFSSIANPGANRDREQFGLSAGTAAGIHTFSATVSRARDNVDDDLTRPVIVNDSAGLTWAMNPSDWPTLSLSYQAGRVESEKEPPATTPTRSTNDALSAAASLAREHWAANLALSRSGVADAANGDSDATSAQFSVTLHPTQDLNLAPTVAYTRSEAAAVTRETRLATLTLGWRVAEVWTLDGQLGHSADEADDGSTDSVRQNGTLRLAWSGSWLKSLFPGQQASVSLAASWSDLEDRVAPANNTSSSSVLLGINVAFPLSGSYGF